MSELMVEIKGTKEYVTAMIDWSHHVPGAKTTRKKRIAANYYKLWYIGEPGSEGDFLRALRLKAGVDKPKPKTTRRRSSKPKVERVIVDEAALSSPPEVDRAGPTDAD